MTLSSRNGFFKIGILFSLLALVVTASASFVIFPVYPQAGSTAIRAAGIIPALVSPFFPPLPYVPFFTMVCAVIYAFITIILIYYFFEKTQCTEILFFALFVVSFAFETIRIMVPLNAVNEFPIVYLVITSRALIFGRYFGLFSLFAASVYAAGLGEQKQGNIVFIIAIAAMVIALGAPVDGLAWDSCLMMISGYASMFKMLEAGIILITMASFFIAAYTRGAKEYILIGIGSFLVFFGRAMLLVSDTWVTPLPGLLMLAAGTWLICVQLHRVYLWL
jgi:hypothetical protein